MDSSGPAPALLLLITELYPLYEIIQGLYYYLSLLIQ